MKRVFSLWLLDIAKYVITVMLISTALKDFASGWFFYGMCLVLVSIIIIGGIYLYKKSEKDDKENNNV